MTNKQQHTDQHTQILLNEQAVNKKEKTKGVLRELFDDLSIAQVIAGALAAATVFLFSSSLGVAGSLIGAAVGSVVSAVSSQIYKKVLSASADKIRDASPTTAFEFSHDTSLSSSTSTDDEMATQISTSDQATRVIHEGETEVLDASRDSQKTQLLGSEKTAAANTPSAATRVMNANDVRYASQGMQDEDPALRRAHVRRSRKAKVQRQVLVVSVVSALITIVIAAVVISVATAGEGIGTKTDSIIPITSEQRSTTQSDRSTSSQDSDSSQSAQDSTSGSQTDEGTSGSDSSQGSDTSSGSNTDDSTSGGSSGTDEGSQSGSDFGASNGGTDTGTGSGGSNTGDSGSGSSGSGNQGSSGSGSTGGSSNTSG